MVLTVSVQFMWELQNFDSIFNSNHLEHKSAESTKESDQRQTALIEKIIQNSPHKTCKHNYSLLNSPWPPSITPPVQAMGVCQSTFGMWFINADIIIHPMATWLFHNDSAGSTLISVGGFWEGYADPPFTPVLWLHARPQFLKTPPQRKWIMVLHGFIRNSACKVREDPGANMLR